MLGAIIGDIVGSVYEFNNHRVKNFEPLFHPEASFTDDTVCTIAVADALVNGRHPAETLKDWGTRYWENGGWGRSFALWLCSDSLAPYNSFGNGAAMRVSPAGLLAGTEAQATELAHHVTHVTHNHPEGLKGAAATASAIFLARHGYSQASIRKYVSERFGYDLTRTPDEIRPANRFDESCQVTVPQALTCALVAEDYVDAIRTAVSIGGDSDTIAAIAGRLAEALFGIPNEIAWRGWSYLPEEMQQVLSLLYSHAGIRNPGLSSGGNPQ